MPWICWIFQKLVTPSFFFGILPFMLSYSKICVRFHTTFPLVLATKLAMASYDKADSYGPLMTASWISSLVQFLPVLKVHPPVSYFSSVSYAVWWTANPEGHMLFRCLPGGVSSSGEKKSLSELTNMTVIMAPPDRWGLFADFPCTAHYQFHPSPFYLLITLVDSDHSNVNIAVFGHRSPAYYFPHARSMVSCACGYWMSYIDIHIWLLPLPQRLYSQWFLSHWHNIPYLPQGLASQWSETHWINLPPPPQCFAYT